MRVIAYLRVSTQSQADDGAGLDVQAGHIDMWATRNHHEVVAYLREEGVSGSNSLEHRKALPTALGMIQQHEAEGLVVYRLDRLARDLIVQETLLAQFRRHGAQVFTCSEVEAPYLQDDPKDPSRKLIRQVLGAVAEYERSMITLRLQAGRYHKASRGGFAFGSPPYGYKAQNKELVPVPEEQAVIDYIFELDALKWMTQERIAVRLTEEGYRSRSGKAWHPSGVFRILKRERPKRQTAIQRESPS